MRLPRDLAGDTLAARLCRYHGYALVRQTDRHICLNSTYNWVEHQISIPRYDFLKVGILGAILSDVASHLKVSREDLAEDLFGSEVLAARKPPLRRDEALAILSEHQAELKQEFAVKSLAVFGSVARDEARADSDVDLLVEFDQSVSLFEFVGLQQHLEGILGRKVDLTTPSSLRPQMRDQILREAIRAA
jgi:predicted nucleotidyltransferase